MNRVVLVGRITRDPELRTSPNQVNFTSFTIAVNRQAPNAQGERVADFINCVAFNKQAENLTRFIHKGGLIGVEGRLQSRTYQAQDGTNRTAIEVICDTITFLESRNANQNVGAAPSNYQANYQPNNYQNNYQGSYQGGYQNNNQNNQYGQYGPQNNQSYNRPTYSQPVEQTPENLPTPDFNNNNLGEQEEKLSAFDNVDLKFDVSDDDLPF